MKYFIFLWLLITGSNPQKSSKLELEITCLPELVSYLNNKPLDISLSCTKANFKKKLEDQSLGKIIIDSLPSGKYTLWLSCSFYDSVLKRDISFNLFKHNILVSETKCSNIKVVFPDNCDNNKHALNKTCPTCNKQDLVIPIIYGLLDLSNRELGEVEKDYLPGGCMFPPCSPFWYCKRDSSNF